MPGMRDRRPEAGEEQQSGARAGVESLVRAALGDIGDLRRDLAREARSRDASQSVPEARATSTEPPIIAGSVPCSICPEPSGVDNCCGQVAIGTVLSSHGLPADEAELQRMNPAGIFTAPPTIVAFLDDRCGAAQHNGGTLDDLRESLDTGHPIVALVNANGVPHWVTVTGYTADGSGRVTGIEVTDHVIGAPSRTLSAEEFARIWEAPLAGVPGMSLLTDYKNLWIETGTKSDLAKRPFSTATEDLVGSAINKLVAGWRNSDFPKLLSGVTEGIVGIAGATCRLPGRILGFLGERIVGWAYPRMESGGALERSAAGASWAAGQAMSGVGTALSAVGNGVSTMGCWVGRGVERAGSSFLRLWPF